MSVWNTVLETMQYAINAIIITSLFDKLIK
jgi:hypothetical protein